jgi:tRNA(Ile)-lysidine synthase
VGQPDPAVAAVRLAVRRALADLPGGALVLVACSGGADSLALAAAVTFEARAAPWRAGLVTVDHGLQPGSSQQAERVRGWAVAAGLDPVVVCPVAVGTAGGPEAAARSARYAALDRAAEGHRAAAVLLGHTLDDQAETVLLALARGSGARSLSGMAPVRGRYRRPLLRLPRAVTVAACAGQGLDPWEDPHNADSGYTRVRVRAVLRALEEAAPGATCGLARSADLLRADADGWDEIAELSQADVTGADGSLDCAALGALRSAVRTRVLRAAALASGVPAGALTYAHSSALDALVVAWSGQGPVSLPGGVAAVRGSGRLTFWQADPVRA